jgi:hypothetical protein
VYITNTTDGFFYNSAVVSGCSLSQSGTTGRILDFTPELCKLAVVGAAFSEGTATIGLTNGSSIEVTVHRVDPSYTAVHHFEVARPATDAGAEEFARVDPLSQQNTSYSVVGGVVGSSEDEYPLSTSGFNYTTTGTVDLWETYIGKYLGISGSAVNTYAVSNIVQEIKDNDEKRKIKILHPRYKRLAVQELEALLSV